MKAALISKANIQGMSICLSDGRQRGAGMTWCLHMPCLGPFVLLLVLAPADLIGPKPWYQERMKTGCLVSTSGNHQRQRWPFSRCGQVTHLFVPLYVARGRGRLWKHFTDLLNAVDTLGLTIFRAASHSGYDRGLYHAAWVWLPACFLFIWLQFFQIFNSWSVTWNNSTHSMEFLGEKMAQWLQSLNRCLKTSLLFIIHEGHSRKWTADCSWVTWGEFKRKLFTKREQGVRDTKGGLESPGLLTPRQSPDPESWREQHWAHEDPREGRWGIALLTASPFSLWPPARGTPLAEPTGSRSTRETARRPGQGSTWGQSRWAGCLHGLEGTIRIAQLWSLGFLRFLKETHRKPGFQGMCQLSGHGIFSFWKVCYLNTFSIKLLLIWNY